MACATSRLVVVGLIVWHSSAAARADEFDVIKSYRFIPKVSRVEQSGGIAGFHETFTVRGTFDLNLGPEVSIPELEIHPSFENVESWLIPHSLLAYVLDTDRVFNLSGLKGTYDRPNRIEFRGLNNQSATVKINATLAGPLLHLRGGTQPPCCDFFGYTIDAYAHLAPFADFNFDGKVDASDYTAIRDHFGTVSGATLDQGDADGDGDVDQADYLVWKSSFGATFDMAALADAVSLTAPLVVPEPSTTPLLFVGALLFVALSEWFDRRRG